MPKIVDPIRYYIINTRCLERVIMGGGRSKIVMSRPTQWSVFFRGVLRLDDELAFVRLSDSLVYDFLSGNVAYRKLPDGRIKISQYMPIEIEPWTFINMCKFCLEGLQYGTFQRYWNWRI